MTGRFRGGYGVKPVGAELARDGGGSVYGDVGWYAAIASKLGSYKGWCCRVRHRCKGHLKSKRLIWHFNAVDCPGTTLYANRLHRPDPVDAGRRLAPDRTGGSVAVATGADCRRCLARLADARIACCPRSRTVSVSVPATVVVLRRLAHAQARVLASTRADPDVGGRVGVVHCGRRRLFHPLVVARCAVAGGVCPGRRAVADRCGGGLGDCP
ncbi:hypothetical protein D3C71_1392830 [compost metagenome]